MESSCRERIEMETDEPNPLCACGCGLEVIRPQNSWICGHSAKTRLSMADLAGIKRLMDIGSMGGWPRWKICERFDVGTVTIDQIGWGWGYVESPAGFAIPPGYDPRQVLRRGEIERAKARYRERRNRRREINAARLALKDVKNYLRELARQNGRQREHGSVARRPMDGTDRGDACLRGQDSQPQEIASVELGNTISGK